MTDRFPSAIPLALLLTLACAPSRSGDEQAAASETGTSGTSGTESESETESETESESETETETESETETGPGETESETETGDDPDLGECPTLGEPVAAGTVTNAAITEASGMVASRSQDVLWVHNDSGDSARLFAIGLDGSSIAVVELAGAGAIDWEDLAIGPGPSPGDHLYAGDIGDNAEARPGITVYRVAEPADVAEAGPDPIVLDTWAALELTYPDGPHNAETLLVDPVTGDLFIVTKGTETKLYRKPAPLDSGELEALPDPNYPSAITTAGDISPLGDFVIVRGYGDPAYLWLRSDEQSIGEAMLAEPCTIPLASEQQGETIAIDAAGLGYFTLSEGGEQSLWRYSFAD